MDGQQGKLNPSLQRHLNRWILSTTAVFALLASLVSAWVAFDEARELQDNLLHQIATLVTSRTGNIALPDMTSDPEDTLILQRIGDSKSQGLPIPVDIADGLHTLDVQGNSWRILVYTSPTASSLPSTRFAISQQTIVRDEVAWGNSLRTLLPMLLLAPILMAVASFAVNHSLKPLRTLAKAVDQHDETCLDALTDERVPQEIIPFITSINHLLARLRQAIAQQQRFVADAAHELRTPVTALSLLAENLDKAGSLDEARARLAPLQEGLVRMRVLVAQLLDLARLQGESQAATQGVAFQPIVQDVIAELYPLAKAKSIDLGMPRNEMLTTLDVSGNLRVLVRNAVENAIRYTPAGGQVDVSLFAENGQVVLLVEDTGNGISVAELQRVFEPFYRGADNTEPGNGLGLAISHEIAHRLGGVIRLYNRSQGGLVFRFTCKNLSTVA